jgi:hypothetical protein
MDESCDDVLGDQMWDQWSLGLCWARRTMDWMIGVASSNDLNT